MEETRRWKRHLDQAVAQLEYLGLFAESARVRHLGTRLERGERTYDEYNDTLRALAEARTTTVDDMELAELSRFDRATAGVIRAYQAWRRDHF